MTPEERAAAEALVNGFLQNLLVLAVLGWWAWWAWHKLGLPSIDWRHYLSMRPRDYVTTVAALAASASGTQNHDLPDTNQLEPAGSEEPRTSSELPDEAALTRHIASLTKPNGQWWLSANKIAAAVGGERKAVLKIVREVRGAIPGERMLAVDHGKRAITWET